MHQKCTYGSVELRAGNRPEPPGQATFLRGPWPAARTQCASETEHRRHLSLPVRFSKWSLPIQTFTNNDQLIFS